MRRRRTFLGWNFSVIGDRNARSMVMATLVPMLTIILVFVLVEPSGGPVPSPEEIAPLQLVASTGAVQSEAAPQTPDPQPVEPAESPAAPAAEPSEPVVEPSEPAVEDKAPIEEAVVVEVAQAEPKRATPKPKVKVQSGKVTVKGILYSNDNPAAIIGNELVHVGDVVSDATVVKITKDRVVFEKRGQRWGHGVLEVVALP